ncbi:MAG: DUF3179 domain-containing protein [Pseudomonadota bacterium]
MGNKDSIRNCTSLSVIVMCLVVLGACGQSASLASDTASPDTTAETPALFGLTNPSAAIQLGTLERLDREWEGYLTPALLEYIRLAPTPDLQRRALALLQKRTRQDFGFDMNAWFAWAWAQKPELPPHYADFKSRLYAQLDDRFAGYFSSTHTATVRLDEVRWGGVKQDGIPPLRAPKMIPAADADYLEDHHIVFGLEVNGDVRAYPKRILAWHEMFVDTVGGEAVVGVYCTLCGSMILYESTVNGVEHQMGTSGFLYRSNKLMYDQATQSLWNTMWGTPVIGTLADSDIRLPRRSVVTTTWGEWRRRHPDSRVLSLDTGHRRDYGEGVAYRAYFGTDELMFNTAAVDNRLANKADVLGIVFNDSEHPPLAIAASYARANPLLTEQIGNRTFVVITDGSGAMRVYDSSGVTFEHWDQDRELRDATGQTWTVSEDRIVSAGGDVRHRLPSHNAFWFGWYGAYTNTRLLY